VEALAAELARVRSRVRVDQQVRGESGRALEGLAALFALENLLYVVNGSATEQQEAMRSGSLLLGVSEVWINSASS
jgi:hypothetical protein